MSSKPTNLSLAEKVAIDTLSVLHQSDEHTAQFYIVKANPNPLYENFLYVAEPMEDTEKVLGAGIISISTQYNHGILHLLFPARVDFIIPVFLFQSDT